MFRCRWLILLCLLAGIICFASCNPEEQAGYVNANRHGVLPENSGIENSQNLQKLIDSLSQTGGTVYIPAGTYTFAQNGKQTIGEHCIHMKSNVSIRGDGENTILMPVGRSAYGLDMFYHNPYLDTGVALYLENCTFSDFVIDGVQTSCETYTSAGKGFMFNLFRNCHWRNIAVYNTDATGFGVDCPINSSMTGCVAIHCGKAATSDQTGASGFGIGFGYADHESISIENCTAIGNRKFGFFMEHQGRFDPSRYPATKSGLFAVENCHASENLYNFGGIQAIFTQFTNCVSEKSKMHGYYFENSSAISLANCKSSMEADCAYAFRVTDAPKGLADSRRIAMVSCSAEECQYGVFVCNDSQTAVLSQFSMESCILEDTRRYTIFTQGKIEDISVRCSEANIAQIYIDPQVKGFQSVNNSWD